jgi:hydrogenase maturation protein HypF
MEGAELMRQAWGRDLNCSQSTSAGRLFDGAASLLDLCQQASFEGQGPMLLESLAGRPGDAGRPLPLTRDGAGCWRADWRPLVEMLLDTTLDARYRASCFHVSLARTLTALAEALRQEYGITTVGLSGGVFQNRILAEMAHGLLEKSGFDVLFPVELPCNDGGLSYGQVVEAAAHD